MEFASKLIRGTKKRVCKQAGFTLVELIVVIVIIAIISVLAFPDFMRSLRRARFEKTVGEVVVLLEKARTQALASELDSVSKIPSGGYGVYFDFTSFVSPALPTAQQAVLFIDDYNAAEGKAVKVDYADEDIVNRVMPDEIYTAGSDSVIEIIDINEPDYIQIAKLKGDKLLDGSAWAHAMKNKVTMIFRPPYAETTIFGDGEVTDADLKNFEIEFKLVTENICRQIKFNRVTTTPQIFKAACS